MKKLIFLLSSLLLLVNFNVVAQTTVIIQPHFGQGKENVIGYADSTSVSCIGTSLQYAADANQYTFPEFDAIAWTAGGCPDIYRHMIRFDALSDTSLIPHSAIILSAHLIIYGTPSSPGGNYGNSYYPGTPYPNTNQTWLYELSDSFNTYTVTWNTQPSVVHTDSISIPSSYSHWNETDTIDVTTMVADMVAHVNTGFLFRLQNESFYRERMYASCYYSDSTLHPKLIISLECINPITVEPKPDTVLEGANAKFTVASSLGAVTYQWQEDPGTGFVNLTNVWPYSGVTTDTLTIHNTSIYLDSTHYRCIVSNGVCNDTSSSAILIVHHSTGVKTLTAESINIFPNPAHDNITVQLPSGVNNGNIELLNGIGQLVSEKMITGKNVTFDLGQLPDAIYILKIAGDEGVIYKKVIKN